MLSGGLDSATCLYWSKEKFSDVSAITFNYFGRLTQEKRAAAKLAKSSGVTKLLKVDLSFAKETSDFYYGRLKKQDSESRWSSYVPARNLIFYSIAAHHAEFLGARWIVGGHNLHDATFFKDASTGYIGRLNALLEEGCLLCNGQPYKVLLPLARMNRKQIVRLAIKLKIPVEQTWSCHAEGKVHCGRCYACKQRREAFGSLGLRDPAFKA